jgi:hypothetical protein
MSGKSATTGGAPAGRAIAITTGVDYWIGRAGLQRKNG